MVVAGGAGGGFGSTDPSGEINGGSYYYPGQPGGVTSNYTFGRGQNGVDASLYTAGGGGGGWMGGHAKDG